MLLCPVTVIKPLDFLLPDKSCIARAPVVAADGKAAAPIGAVFKRELNEIRKG